VELDRAEDRLTHTSLQGDGAGDARVTVGLRIHKGMRIEHLDQAASSLALQTYKQFKTVLLVDGPWSYGEQLAQRYNLPLICTGLEPDITHCSGLHRKAVGQCETEFYKPLDYDDQLAPGYLERAVATLDRTRADVYGCLLMTLDEASGQFSERPWPHKPLETMFTGNPGDNMLPHSSVLMRTSVLRAAGSYQEKAVGLGADDYNVWYRIHKAGGKFVRDDAVRNVVYRIHDKNSLKIRKARYGAPDATKPGTSRPARWIAGATAASIALFAAPGPGARKAVKAAEPAHVTPADAGKSKDKKPGKPAKTSKALTPPHS
jgi:hypothetical protein